MFDAIIVVSAVFYFILSVGVYLVTQLYLMHFAGMFEWLDVHVKAEYAYLFERSNPIKNGYEIIVIA